MPLNPIRLVVATAASLALALTGCTDDDTAGDEVGAADEVEGSVEGSEEELVDEDPLDEEPEGGVIGEDEALGVDQTMAEEEEFFDNPLELVGSRLTFTGSQGRAVGDSGFFLVIGDNELLVLAEEPPDATADDVELEVTGEVEVLSQEAVEEAGLTWSQELQAYEDDVVMVAGSIEVVDEVPDEDDTSDEG